MPASYKLSCGGCNTKRDNLAAAAPPRSRRGRKPETLQRFHEARLQDWMRFANLRLEDSAELTRLSEIAEPLSGHGALPARVAALGRGIARGLKPDLVAPASPEPRSQSSLRPATLAELTRLSEKLEAWPLGADLRPGNPAELLALHDRAGEILAGLASNGPSATYTRAVEALALVQIDARGRVGECRLASPLEKLFDALRRVEANRIRRCPICRGFFFAVRANKGACDEHLTLARARRGRNPELRRQYEETRRINRLVREGKPIGQAKAEVHRKKRERRTVS